jgi:ABC-type Zn uptake system ZnuABC Zn-binding protein ZnuA
MEGLPRRRVLAAAAAIALLAGCAAPGGGTTDPNRLEVVATTTVIGDLVANVGGDRVSVTSLVPPGGEPHTFDPAPSDITILESAAIVFSNGLGLDEWLGDLVTDSGTDAPLVELGEDLVGVEYREGGAHAQEGGSHEGEPAASGDPHAGEEHAVDPHVWLNVAYAKLYVDRIADELTTIDAEGADLYAANAEAYGAQLDELDGYVRDTLEAIPEEHRNVVSFHEAFGYFAEAYGLTVVDTVVEAPGQDPSAGEVDALIHEIAEHEVRAILAEAQFPTDLVDRIAEETGASVVADLYTDSVGPPPADTYVSMLRADVDAIAAALD